MCNIVCQQPKAGQTFRRLAKSAVYFTAAVVALLFSPLAEGQETPAGGRRPNVVLILADDK